MRATTCGVKAEICEQQTYRTSEKYQKTKAEAERNYGLYVGISALFKWLSFTQVCCELEGRCKWLVVRK